MLAVGTFGVGFIMRPVGGVVLGAYADRAGRKAAMSLTLWLMTLGSAIIAFAPTYAAIGVAAPVLVIVARLVQGFALGGEVGASTSLLMEYGSDKTRGFYGSWQFVSEGMNTVCGSLLGVALAAALSTAALESWGWRVPFVIGMAMGPIGIYIRRHLNETLPGVEDGNAPVNADAATQPVRKLFRDHSRSIAAGVVTTIGGTAANYIVLFYLSTYAIRILHLPMSSALWAAWTAAAVTVVCSPFAGALSDRVGRKPVLLVSRVLLIAAVYPAFIAINASPTVPVLLAVVAALAVLVAFTAVPNIVMLPELFPREIRATGDVDCLLSRRVDFRRIRAVFRDVADSAFRQQPCARVVSDWLRTGVVGAAAVHARNGGAGDRLMYSVRSAAHRAPQTGWFSSAAFVRGFAI